MKQKMKNISMAVLTTTIMLTSSTSGLSTVFGEETNSLVSPTNTITTDGYTVIGQVMDVSVSSNKVNISYETGEKMQLICISKSLFRMYLAPAGEDFRDYPVPNSANHTATITIESDSDLADGTATQYQYIGVTLS